ncbi:hypothetical protein GM3709_1381 [Geminocystis sp. NIES-3709]|nr:hypothetical protein GM3709_724 [Geminocystis sp. NIES-3709]BAQ64616.1 hypothetical protein GM3709_1381 [Geminocystis sp. NIES-3709]
MYGAFRRSFQAERIWGWGRDNVQLGLEEERTGIICWEQVKFAEQKNYLTKELKWFLVN